MLEQHVRALTLAALEQRQPWALRLGQPPADPVNREDWLRRLDTVAAYRERWQANAGAALGDEPRSHEQAAHYESARYAVKTALAIAHPADLVETCPQHRRSLNPKFADLDYRAVVSDSKLWNRCGITSSAISKWQARR